MGTYFSFIVFKISNFSLKNMRFKILSVKRWPLACWPEMENFNDAVLLIDGYMEKVHTNQQLDIYMRRSYKGGGGGRTTTIWNAHKV